MRTTVTPSTDEVRARHAVTEHGIPTGPTVVLLHGFGGHQGVWHAVVDRLATTHRVLTLDHVGCGAADLLAHDPVRHATVDGYAQDVAEVLRVLDLRGVTLVGHSVGGAIGALACALAPEHVTALVTVGTSARYLDDEGYVGGFSQADVDELLLAIDDNYLDWAQLMAPVFVGNPDRPELAREFHAVLGRLDPAIARQFARATFATDIRARLAEVTVPTMVLQCADDAVVPDAAAELLARALPLGRLVRLDATGHCPLLSAPDQVADAVRVATAVPVV